MTTHPNLIERAATRLREDNDRVASELLRRQPAAKPAVPAPPAAARSAGELPAAPARPPETPPSAVAPDPPPHIEAAMLRRAGLIDPAQKHSRLSDEFRIVQGQVLQAMAQAAVRDSASARTIMLTSARPGEGKTFSSLNLAGSLASYGQQPVILVDLDAKQRTLSTRLGIAGRAGLLDLSAHPEADTGGFLIETSLPNLRVIPAGQLEQQGMAPGGRLVIDAIERLGRCYPDCLIVLDTPACLSSSAPSMLAPLVREIVMLVEAQKTQRAELEAALDLVEACPTVLLLLNKVQLTASDTFGAYGY